MNDSRRASERPSGSGRLPRIIPCEEQGPVDIHIRELLDADGELQLNPEIEKGDFFNVSLRKGVISLRARGYIGYVPLTDKVIVHVKSRNRIKDLSRIVELSGEPPTVLSSLRGYTTIAQWNESLLDVYAAALAGYVEQIASRGILREYARREESSSSPKGRILIGETLRSRGRGQQRKAHIAWYERRADNEPNRCIKYAIWLLSHRYMGLKPTSRESRQTHRRLSALYAMFSDVSLDHSQRFLAAPEVTGAMPLPSSRSYYRDALNVSSAVIHQRAVLLESLDGPVRLPSMVLNMDDVFEAYVRNVLSRYVDGNGLPLAILNGNNEGRRGLYNGADLPDATPDIVVDRRTDAAPLIIEVKNVPLAGAHSRRRDVNQALTYALVYKAKRVMLVHPRASAVEPSGLRHIGDVDSVEVYQYRFDLGADDLLDEDERLGHAVVRLCDLPAIS